MIDFHRTYMAKAVDLAKKAAACNEVPIGALVVDSDGIIIGQGYNQVEQKKSQLAHAELRAIAQATKIKGDWRLDGCTLYVTIEPCSMCFGAIMQSRLSAIVYGADSPRFGYQLDNIPVARVYKKNITIWSGVHAKEAKGLLQDFFQIKRKKKGECKVTESQKNQAGLGQPTSGT